MLTAEQRVLKLEDELAEAQKELALERARGAHHRSLFDGKRELRESGVGPITIDIDHALLLGWTKDEVQRAHDALVLIARGAHQTMQLRKGTMCEHCGGCSPTQLPIEEGKLPKCGACGRIGVSVGAG